MILMQTQEQPTPFFTGEPFEQAVAILIALVTIIAMTAGYLQSDASTRSSKAGEDAQRYALQAIGERAPGEVQVSFAWADAYRLWLEQDRLAGVADNQQQTQLANAYRTVRDHLSEINPLLSPFYFDPAEDEFPDVNAYEADIYLKETTIFSEHFANSSHISSSWGNKSTNYVNQITLLTVTLFLYGLSTTIIGRVSWLFVGIGTLIASITLVWMVLTVMTPVHSLPSAAITAYATGVGLAFQQEHAQAIIAFDESLKLAPAYANAYYERAKAQAHSDQLETAAADYEAARRAGRNDAYVPWNLGWTYYLLGRFDQAEQTTRQALSKQPNQVVLRFNLALMQLAAGKIEAANADYEQGMAAAIQQVSAAKMAGEEPPATLWWYLSAAALDLDPLLACLQSHESKPTCKQSPPKTALPAGEPIMLAARAIRRDLKNLTTALELTGSPPPPLTRASVDALKFVEPIYAPDGTIESFVAFGTRSASLRSAMVYENAGRTDSLAISRGQTNARLLFVSFNYHNFEPGQLLVIKVYTNGVESSGLRLSQEWTLNSEGRATLPLTAGGSFSLQPGDYQVELYVDSNLLQEGRFIVG